MFQVRAFYQGKTSFIEPKTAVEDEDDSNVEAFIPLTETHAPKLIRRKIFLDRLDQV